MIFGRRPGSIRADEDEDNCTIDDLVEGAVVHEADFDLRNGEAVFDEIELAR